jgi:cysteinyl-tRNA synthetase
MSKSEGNFLTIRDLISKGYDPLAFRLFVFSHHYRNKVDFTFEKLDKYVKTLENFDQELKMIAKLPEFEESEGESFESLKEGFRLALSSDLNTYKAFQIFSKFMDSVNDYIFRGKIGRKTKANIFEALKFFDSGIGVFKEYEIPEEIRRLADKRKDLREAGLLKEADQIRDEILTKGYKVIDMKNDYILIKSRGP